MRYKTILLMIFAIAVSVLIIGCGDSNEFNEKSNNSMADTNGSNENLVEEQRANAKVEIENYISEISPSLSDDGKEYVEYVKSVYLPAIEEETDRIDKLKQICLLKIEQAFIRNTQDFEIEKLNEEYNPAIDNVCSWLDDLLDLGIYRGSEMEYDEEIEDISEQLRQLALEKERAKEYYARVCVLNGYSQSWLQNKYSEYDAKYKKKYNDLVGQKDYLRALWKNREKYDEYLVLLGGLEEERDALIAEINEEYDLKYQELGQQISELEK